MREGLPRLYDSADDLGFDEDPEPEPETLRRPDLAARSATTRSGGGSSESESGIRAFFQVVADELEDTQPFRRLG